MAGSAWLSPQTENTLSVPLQGPCFHLAEFGLGYGDQEVPSSVAHGLRHPVERSALLNKTKITTFRVNSEGFARSSLRGVSVPLATERPATER